MRNEYYRSGEIFIIVFAVTSRISFEGIRSIHAEILKIKDTTPTMILVGNKHDLLVSKLFIQYLPLEFIFFIILIILIFLII